MTHDHRQEIIDKTHRLGKWLYDHSDTHVPSNLILEVLNRIIKERKIFRDDLIKLNSLCKNWVIK